LHGKGNGIVQQGIAKQWLCPALRRRATAWSSNVMSSPAKAKPGVEAHSNGVAQRGAAPQRQSSVAPGTALLRDAKARQRPVRHSKGKAWPSIAKAVSGSVVSSKGIAQHGTAQQGFSMAPWRKGCAGYGGAQQRQSITPRSKGTGKQP